MIFRQSGARVAVLIAAVSGISVARAATITGIVTTGKDAKPIAGASVIVQSVFQSSSSWVREGDSTKPVVTSADGHFSVDVPDSDKLQKPILVVFVVAPGYGIQQIISKDEKPLSITLMPERTIQGTVTDTQGKPVANAVVFLGGVILSTVQN